MKKRNLILFASVGVVSMASAVVGAIAWFDSALSFKAPNVTGKSAGAYFYSGDGSAEDPFTIMHPRHLYNLAWLQDMGIFNKQKKDENGQPMVDEEGNPIYEQIHFKLHDALKSTGLDMGGWTLPPIGTQQYPFLGEFIGNDVTVSNFTISNDFADYGNNHPTSVSSFSDDNIKQPEIVGIFGVVGKFNEEGNYVYDTNVNSVTNFAAKDFTVNSNTSKTLIGLAAGYVNGTVNNVAVDDGSLTIEKDNAGALNNNITTKLSDHTVVGYCTKDYKTDVKSASGTINGVDVNQQELTVNDSGDDDQAPGGSIKMNKIYNRVLTIRNASMSGSGPGTSQVTVKDVVYEKDGVTEHSHTDRETRAFFDNYHSTNYETGNYQLYERGSNPEYMYLAGGHYENTTYIEDYYKHTGFLITQDNVNFMSTTSRELTNNMNVTNSTNPEANPAIVWNIFDGDSGTVTTTYNATPYYLRAVSTTNLQVTTNASNATQFTKTEYNGKTLLRCRLNNTDYYLGFNNGSWRLLEYPILTWEDPDTHVPQPSKPRPEEGDEPDIITPAEESSNYLADSYQIYYTVDEVTYYLDRNNPTNFTSVVTKSGEKPLGYGWQLNLQENNKVSIYSYNNGNNTKRYLTPNNNNSALTVSTTEYNFDYTNVGGGIRISYNITTSGSGCGGGDTTTTYYIRYNGSNVVIGEQNTNSVFSYTPTTTAISNYNAKVTQEFNDLIEEWDTWSDRYTEYETDYLAEVARIEQAVKDAHKLQFVQITNENPVIGPDYYIDSSKTRNGMVYSNEDTTYFPINVTEDGERPNFKTDQSYYPKDGNTGYIIAGSTYTNSNTSNQDNFRNTTNIRISSYPISNINSSYNSSSQSIITSNNKPNIYTLNDQYAYVKASTANYENFDDTLPKLQAILSEDNNNDGNVLGLHFMDAEISKDKTVVAKSVKLNKTTYSDYELPVNSIDFNLFKKGFINFFAGMYFGGNNSFFSLHEIMRDSETNEIIDIKQIEAVYSDGIESHSYVYKFTDGKYSKAYQYNRNGAKVTLMLQDYTESFNETYTENNGQFTLSYVDPTDNLQKTCTYKSVFNTQRITNHWFRSESGHSAGGIVHDKLTDSGTQTVDGSSVTTKSSIFYYEIPMNAGEFALGSVSGGTGGYLFYLDIGANAKKLSRTSIYQHYLFLEELTTFPNGVAVLSVNVGSAISVAKGDGACASIDPNYNSTLVVERNDDTINITQGYDDDYIIGNYKSDDVLFKSGAPPGGDDIDIVTTTVSTETRRLEYYDFNVGLQEETHTVITRTIIKENNVQKSDTIDRQQYLNGTLVYDSTDPDLDDASKAEFYDSTTGKPVAITTLTPPNTGTNTETPIVLITFTGMLSEPLTIVVDASRVGTSTYYTVNGIVVNITADENDTITITATKADGASESITITQSGHYIVTIGGLG